MATIRNTQLDGWRAVAVVGIMCLHWRPAYFREVPFLEIGVFFFLTLTGFLITRVLLRTRDEGEASGKCWKIRTSGDFLCRRMARIFVPCYVGMLFAFLVGAKDVRLHPWLYAAHVSNFHMAWLPQWPEGSAHYWTLAIQMQFYLFWPFVVFLTPRKWLMGIFGVCVALAPLSRFVLDHWFPEIFHGEAITIAAMDYFGTGALLALALERGMSAGDRRLKIAGWGAAMGYFVLYGFSHTGKCVHGFCYVQQTLLAVAFTALISSTLAGFSGFLKRFLDHPVAQHLGRISYGLYLFHVPMPLFLGWVMPWLWRPIFAGPLEIVRIAVFALASWGAAWLCWRWLEGPDRVRIFQLVGQKEK